MINRKWPSRWTTRRSGGLLAVLALTLMSTLISMQQRLEPVVPLTFGNILRQIHNDLRTSLFQPSAIDMGFSMLNLNISGGYVGGIEFALLFSLFGRYGATLIMIVMLAISFMLITGLSYVDIVRLLRGRLGELGKLMGEKVRMLRPIPVKNRNRREAKPVAVLPNEYEEEDEVGDLLAEGVQQSQSKKKPIFFQLFGYKGSPAGQNQVAHEDYIDENQQNEPLEQEPKQGINWNELKYEGHQSEDFSAEDRGPIIRDFFDNIQRETRLQDEDEDMEGGLGSFDNESTWSEEQEAVPDTLDHESLMDEASLEGNDSVIEPDASSEVKEGEMDAPIAPPKPAPKPYKLPPFRLLSKPAGSGKAGDQADYMQTARKLEATLESFGVRARVLEVVRGPAVTRYEVQPDIGVKVSRIVNLTDDIALALAAKDIRMEAPIPGKSAIGIEVPNNEVSIVTMREVMETPTFTNSEARLTIAFGRDISGQTIVGNLAKMPHLLVAGATGSGKSVCINGIITSILYKAKPDEVKFMMVDPKMVELNVYNGIPHLLTPVVTDPRRASLALKKIVVEMEKRYELFSKSGARNIEGYNQMMQDNPEAILPYIVVIVDELADLMMVAANDVEDAIARLAQMARAAGIHLIIATQRPSVDVITGVIKANIPSRIAFGVSSQVDSRTILDMAGAEKLLGRGDMLYMPMGASKPTRVQGAFMSDQEVETIVSYVRSQGQAEYDESLVPEIDEESTDPEEVLDELYDQAVQIVLEAKQASVSLLQRRMRVGYTRAARLIDSMEARGIVGPYEGSKPREVLLTMEQFKMNNNKISS